MKNKYLLLSLVALSFVFGCGKPLKDVDDYFPELQIVEVTPKSDGSVTVTAKLISSGAGDIEFVGMCLSENGEPTSDDDQKLSQLNGDEFSVNYSRYTRNDGAFLSLENTETYYVKAFATNAFGYSWSEVFEIEPWEIPSVAVPCSLQANYFNPGTGLQYGVASGPTTPSSTYNYTVNSSSASLNFFFGSPLETGTYTTAESSSFLSEDEVFIRVFIGGQSYPLETGSTVYVNQLSPGVFDVVICSGTVMFGANGLPFLGRFTMNG